MYEQIAKDVMQDFLQYDVVGSGWFANNNLQVGNFIDGQRDELQEWGKLASSMDMRQMYGTALDAVMVEWRKWGASACFLRESQCQNALEQARSLEAVQSRAAQARLHDCLLGQGHILTQYHILHHLLILLREINRMPEQYFPEGHQKGPQAPTAIVGPFLRGVWNCCLLEMRESNLYKASLAVAYESDRKYVARDLELTMLPDTLRSCRERIKNRLAAG